MPPVYSCNPLYDYPRDFSGYGEAGLDPKWPNKAKIAVSFVINYEEGGERSVMSGDGMAEQNLRENPAGPPRINERNLNVESEYEYGSRAGFWRMFRMFNEYGMKFTLYAVAQAVEKQPEVARRCVEMGHDVASHAYRWIEYHDFSIEKEKEYIRKGIESLKALTGYAPRGWYYGCNSPHSRTLVPEVYEELGEELVWASDTYADDVPYWIDLPTEASKSDEEAKGCLMVPYSYDCNDFKFHVIGSGFADPDGFFAHLKNAFDVLYEEGEKGMPKRMTVGLHCRIAGRPGRFGALKQFVDYLNKKGVWVATRTEIAEAFKKEYPYKRGKLA
ncbi:polysaccharide deacetylase [Mytilinidion resinicola]|uniref:Polysaccharide deacetylase n=1 Tax=Mytilinidion resinicola TaxID=574789 RepID=A0A6A6Z3F1_9PEZI|nr:polysaccharide deacetylase [Mytilinidion resinicola]KAF2815269.1 polysaccharide deacetylase [Mytilinidion resinicola]